jgi:hypothetical protein
MAGLEVQIGADAAELEAEIAKVTNILKRLEKQKQIKVSIGADTGDLDKKIEAATAKLNNFKKVADSTGDTIKKFNGKVGDGGNALTQISRIAQDAPFGFIAIGNNITAAGESMGYLVKQTGSVGGAFKALGASLAGPGGVLLLISLITTAFTVMSQKGLTLNDVIDSLTGSISDSRKEMQKLEASVAKNAQAQISSVGAYVSAAKNINLSMNDRLIAVRKLQSEYPAYFGNLTKEQILNGNVAGAVKEVTKALINKARATALTSKLVDLASKEEDIYSNLSNFIIRLSKELGLNVKETFELSKAINELVKSGKDFNSVDSASLKSLPERLKQYVLQNGALKDISQQIKNNKYQQEQLTKKINESTAAQLKLETVKETSTKTRADLQAVSKLTPVKSTDDQNDRILAMFRDQLSDDLTKLKTVPIVLNIPVQPNLDTVGITLESIRIQKLLNELNDSASEIINKGLADTFSNLGEIIGNGLSKGSNVLNAVGDTLLATLGSILMDLGKMAISTGIGILAIQTALKSLNPYVAIGAGVALIALGSTIKGSVKSLGGGASSTSSATSGGSGLSSGSTGADYSSPASPGNFSSGLTSSGSSTVVFEISGTSLIGVLSNTLDKNNRLGGGSLGLGL